MPVWLTLIAIVIAAATLYAGYQSWRTGSRQELTAHLQYRVMQAQVQPEFVLKMKTRMKKSFFPWLIVNWPSHILVSVANDGFPVRDVRLYPMASLDVRFIEGNQIGAHDLLVPIPDTGFVQWGFRSTKGTLAYMGFGDLRKERRAAGVLDASFRVARRTGTSVFPKKYKPLRYNFIFCVMVKYVDALGEEHRELYVVGPTVSERIPDELATRLIDQWTAQAEAGAAYFTLSMGSDARRKIAERLWAACKAVHKHGGNDETLWPDIEIALGRSGDTGVSVDHYTWPLDFPPRTPE